MTELDDFRARVRDRLAANVGFASWVTERLATMFGQRPTTTISRGQRCNRRVRLPSCAGSTTRRAARLAAALAGQSPITWTGSSAAAQALLYVPSLSIAAGSTRSCATSSASACWPFRKSRSDEYCLQ